MKDKGSLEEMKGGKWSWRGMIIKESARLGV